MEQAKKNLREAVDEKAKDLWAKYDADKKPVSIPIDKADKDEAAIAEVNTQEKINPTPVVEAPVVAPEGNNPIRSSIDIAMEKTDHLVEKKPAVKVSPEDDKNQEIKKFWEEEGQHIWAEGKANVQLPTPEAVIAPDLAQPEILEAKTEALVLASQEKENKLKGDLDRARFNYAMADFKANNVLEKIKSVLRIKTDSKNISEVSDAYKYYTDCARALMEFQMKEMERKGLSGETLDKKTAEIVKYFNFDERMNLFDTYNQARAKTIEEKFGKAPGWAMEQGAKFLNWYRKQDWKRKALFGYGVAIIGGGTAVLGMRALGSAAAGYGFVAGREASYRKQEQQKATEEQSQILTQAEKIGEDKFKSIIASLETGIGDYDKKLSIEKREKLKRLGVGVALGATIFALGTAASKMGIGRYIMEKVGWIEHQPEVHFPTAKTSNLEAAVDHHLNQSNQVPEITARGDEMADKAQQAFEKAQAEAAANAPGAVPGGEEMIQTQLGPEDLASGATPENLSEKMVDLAVEKGSSVD
ncbi:MAG: hypothetical protein NTZ97_03495 [Candidatus Moranbacteria bacterium]|nr:hypothetical protein [Candidatus Moranbacteria bacterium]